MPTTILSSECRKPGGAGCSACDWCSPVDWGQEPCLNDLLDYSVSSDIIYIYISYIYRERKRERERKKREREGECLCICIHIYICKDAHAYVRTRTHIVTLWHWAMVCNSPILWRSGFRNHSAAWRRFTSRSKGMLLVWGLWSGVLTADPAYPRNRILI